MQIERHTKEWWFEPELPNRRLRVPRHLSTVNPATSDIKIGIVLKRQTGSFAPSSRWVRWHKLNALDAGYVVPLFNIRDIGTRYGLSTLSMRYFKKNILPEPYGIVRRRSLSSHHWSKFVLMVLDVVLGDLERKGELRFLRRYTDHLELLHTGISWLADHYELESKQENIKSTDKYGVQWYR